ncbi:MAG: glycoside hydrolase family 16 protein [Tepidisphaeraceae bacterium]
MTKRTLSGLALASLALSFTLVPCTLLAQTPPKPANSEYPDFYTGQSSPKGIDFVQSIAVSAPAYCSEVKGDVTVVFKAPGMANAKALCWQQPTPDKPDKWGHDVEVAPDIKLDADGNSGFVFHADQFPNGPITIRIHARDSGKKQDLCELQLFNKGGVVWNQGIPKTDPPAAKGMKLVFADDFDGPLSISRDGKDARYPSHKTGGGDFSGWPFSDNAGDNNPFSQTGTFLRIHASKKPGTRGSTGIISSLRQDGSGVSATAPCYFECRFVAQSAPGTWPAFWTLTKGTLGMDKAAPDYKAVAAAGTDELDIIEGYGGYGPKNPNSGGVYCIVSHFWKQPKPEWAANGPDGKPLHPSSARPDTLALGGKSSWSHTFHTYGVLITQTDTVYYFDDIEVLRHPSGHLSKTQPAWFLINYAIGGISGWKIDLARYGDQSDMWVDFVRVYQGEKK